MLNKLSFKFSWRALCLSIAVGTLLFTSCSMYKAGMENAEYDPIPNKLPNLEYNYGGLYDQLVNNVVKDELYKNVIEVDGKPLGNIQVRCEKLDAKVNFLFPFLSGFTLFMGNILGMPYVAGSIDMELEFLIEDVNGDVVKRYNYSDLDKYTLGFYYGEDARVKEIEMCKSIMDEFKKDVTRDFGLISEALNTPANGIGKDLNYDMLADAVAQKIEIGGTVGNAGEKAGGSAPVKSSDVDVNIPVTTRQSENTFVLIIANENYSFVDNVPYALHDGEIFREYCIKTLGVPERQVWLYKDATAGIISGGVDKMVQAMSIFDNARAIVYYCGHGIPDEHTGDAFIVPTDGKGTNTETCYSLNRLYKTLAESKAENVTYFLDACFSGANKEGSMLVAARGIAVRPKESIIKGNSVVFSAASGDETAMTFEDKSHGLFTYFLLKKLQETKGDVSYGELSDYIKKNVQKEAFLTNEKPQTPVTATSMDLQSTWRSMTLK